MCRGETAPKSKFPSNGRRRAEGPLDLVHSDLCGKINAQSLSGAEYFLTSIDDKTHYINKHKD